MFISFFPRPRLFFLSSILWTALAMAVWYGFASNLFPALEKPVGLATFWSASALWFDLYFALVVAVFAAAWMLFAPHPWATWSILGSALILFTSYFQVQVSVAINSWYGPFYDLVQAALSKSAPVTVEQFYSELATFAGIALVAVVHGPAGDNCRAALSEQQCHCLTSGVEEANMKRITVMSLAICVLAISSLPVLAAPCGFSASQQLYNQRPQQRP